MLQQKDIKGRRVAVALSGGVDSAVAALLLQEQGADVVAMTLLLQEHDDGAKAAAVAELLSVPLKIIDGRSCFRASVMEAFAESYSCGETPNPCVLCNKKLKFGMLLDAAKEEGAAFLATGHYVQRVDRDGTVQLHQGKDPQKDQSYFLYALPQERLPFLLFPLGGLSKQEVRHIAQEARLPLAAQKDSQDICFVPDGDYTAVLNSLRPDIAQKGTIVDLEGRVIGHHEGIIHYTIGQRKGLGLSDRVGENNDPLYVVRLDSARNEVVVGPRDALAVRDVFLQDINWLGGDIPAGGLVVTTRLRSTMAPVSARFFMDSLDGKGAGHLHLESPLYGVAPGQAGVIYDGTCLLGGGVISL
ncbi:MAG: tRNA 2-thiouridine(34) synthase MnmA [Bdellovibrionales bacterium]